MRRSNFFDRQTRWLVFAVVILALAADHVIQRSGFNRSTFDAIQSTYNPLMMPIVTEIGRTRSKLEGKDSLNRILNLPPGSVQRADAILKLVPDPTRRFWKFSEVKTLQLLQEAAQIYEAHYGPGSPESLRVYDVFSQEMGNAGAGRWALATADYDRQLTLLDRQAEPDGLRVVELGRRLYFASTIYSQGREAPGLFPRVERICRHSRGDLHTLISRFYYEAAKDQRLEKERLLNLALAEDRKRDCTDARRAAILLSLAKIYSYSSRLAQAENYSLQSLEIYKSVSLSAGEADAESLLARVYTAEKKYEQAETILTQLLVREQKEPARMLSNGLVAVAQDHLDLAIIKIAQAKYGEGKYHFQQAEKHEVAFFKYSPYFYQSLMHYRSEMQSEIKLPELMVSQEVLDREPGLPILYPIYNPREWPSLS